MPACLDKMQTLLLKQFEHANLIETDEFLSYLCGDKEALLTAAPAENLILSIHFLDMDDVVQFNHCLSSSGFQSSLAIRRMDNCGAISGPFFDKSDASTE